ncbi:response regulator [Spirochaeta cellobiosiphila]|uniref:response regulator n=1 Tax=Spirochaeta cellobiosiphila TaxID=504483 RepID=UPI0004230DCC|nr:response regulator [Spirochaeta cellobiosiphila]
MSYNKILIVDDSSTSRMIIKRCLYIAGYSESTYIEAEDGLDALDRLVKEDIDLIVSDLNMPKMDGITFIQKVRLKEKYNKLPIIVISSIYNDETSDKLTSYNVTGIIKKPISPNKIQSILG